MKKRNQINPDSKSLTRRPPVVVLLGHVDHGKTTLLSAIAKIDFTKEEYGGITQHTKTARIVGPGGKQITFIDTPGHEAFAKMRSRGVRIADLALLVIDGSEGVKPQTKESLKYIQENKLPYFVVISKIDLPKADAKMIKSQLAKEGVLVEKMGGDIVALEVSAKTKKGLDELLEMILLFAELEEIKAESGRGFKAAVLESYLDPQKGVLVTVLVKTDALRVGQEIFGGKIKVKVRAIFDDQGERIDQIGPGETGRILGFNKNLEVGGVIADKPQGSLEFKPVVTPTADEDDEKFSFRIILKTDVTGTLEAIEESLPEKVMVVGKGVGPVNESDVLKASTTRSTILAFNAPPLGSVKELARTEGVEIVSFKVIYKLLEWLAEKLTEKERVKTEKRISGKAEIIAEFKLKDFKVAGCRLVAGKLTTDEEVCLERNGKTLGKTKIKSIKQKRESVKEALSGQEYGLVFLPELDFNKGDMIISYSDKA